MTSPKPPSMSLGQRQTLKQAQRLMMLPHMQQALTLLQLPILELAAAMELEIQQNPILDSDADTEERTELEDSESEPPNDRGTASADAEISFEATDFSLLKILDDEFRDHFNQDQVTHRQRTTEDAKRQTFFESSLVREMSLRDFLLQQVSETFAEPRDRAIAELLIGYLDDSGYLETPIEEIVQLHGVEFEDTKRILTEIQTFEPIGVASTCLQQSLLTQLRYRGQQSGLAYQAIENHWDDLLHHRIPNIAKHLHTTSEAVSTAIRDQIARLDFHPGNHFGKQSAQPIIPDATIRWETDRLIVVVNDEPLPQVRFNRRYLRMLEDPTLSEETKTFLRQKLGTARWLRKVIDQRNSTLMRIANALIQHQGNYFRDPKGPLVPLTMKEVADELAVHESTIARAVANKYIDCPRGLIALRSFFTNALVAKDGSEVSSRTVRDAIEDLIRRENKLKPFSDNAIARLLTKQGLLCARRTVAKYRGELSIGNAVQRKVYMREIGEKEQAPTHRL